MCLYRSFIISNAPQQKRFILSHINGQISQFCCNIDFKKEKKIPEPRYSKKPPPDFFVIGRLRHVCLTTKPGALLIGQRSQICPDTVSGWNSICRPQIFSWRRLLWLANISWSAQLQRRGFLSRLVLPGNSCLVDIVKAKVLKKFDIFFIRNHLDLK